MYACRDIAAATAAFFKEPGVASAESTPTKAAAAAGSTGSDAKGRSKARVFRLGDYQMKQLRNGTLSCVCAIGEYVLDNACCIMHTALHVYTGR